MGVVEPPARWVPIWRFRGTLLAMALVMGALAIVLVQYFNGAYQGQDPTFQPGGSGLNQKSGTVPGPANPGATAPAEPAPSAAATSSPSANPAVLGGPG